VSIHHLNSAWEANLPTTAKFVLVALADHANAEGLCWPSIARLCSRTGLSERAVRNALNLLEVRGELHRRRRGPRSSIYQLTPGSDAAARGRLVARTYPNPAPPAGHDDVGGRGITVQSGISHRPDRHGAVDCPAPPAGNTGTSCPLNLYESSPETKRTVIPDEVESRLGAGASLSVRPEACIEPKGFQAWWEAHPASKYWAEQRPVAVRAWLAANLELRADQLVERLRYACRVGECLPPPADYLADFIAAIAVGNGGTAVPGRAAVRSGLQGPLGGGDRENDGLSAYLRGGTPSHRRVSSAGGVSGGTAMALPAFVSPRMR
jgi:hypothetical protein